MKDPRIARLKDRLNEQIYYKRTGVEDIEYTIAVIQDLQPFSLNDASALQKIGSVYKDHGHTSRAIQYLRRELDAQPTYLFAEQEFRECYELKDEIKDTNAASKFCWEFYQWHADS